MGVIYKEVVRRKRISFLRVLMLILLFVLSANLLVNSSSYSIKYNIQLGLILAVDCILTIYLLKIAYEIGYLHRIYYTYKLIDKELIFEKVIGGSRKVLLGMDIKNIELFVPAREAKGIKGIDRTYKFICSPLKNRVYCCIENKNGRRTRFYFQPSDELIRKINTILK